MAVFENRKPEELLQFIKIGPVAINHGNCCIALLAVYLGRYGVPQSEVNGTD